MTLEDAVWVDADRMNGAPCFRGSRLPVQHLFDWLADGVPLDEFVEDFRIDRRAAEAVLRAAVVPSWQAAVRTPASTRTPPVPDRRDRPLSERQGGRPNPDLDVLKDMNHE